MFGNRPFFGLFVPEQRLSKAISARHHYSAKRPNATVAQLAEQLICNQQVGSSNLPGGSNMSSPGFDSPGQRAR